MPLQQNLQVRIPRAMRPPIELQRFDGALAARGLGVSLREPVRSVEERMHQSRGHDGREQVLPVAVWPL